MDERIVHIYIYITTSRAKNNRGIKLGRFQCIVHTLREKRFGGTVVAAEIRESRQLPFHLSNSQKY